MKSFLIKLFLGNYIPNRKLKPAICNQKDNLLSVWNNNNHNDFGIERFVRLFLTAFQFISPGLYIKHLFGQNYGLLGRKIGVEILVFLKISFPIFLLCFNITKWFLAPFLMYYSILDTVFYLSYLIFVHDVNAKPITYKRSLLVLFINYIEVALCFAVIYSHYSVLNPCFFNRHLKNNFEPVYYSFITTATVGYGDIFPVTILGQCLAVAQVILFFAFVGIFLNFYSSKIETGSRFDEEVKQNKDKAK